MKFLKKNDNFKQFVSLILLHFSKIFNCSLEGLLSTQEALFHMVPLVGVPMSNDQKPNMMRAEANGFAKMLDLLTMTKGIN